MSDGPLDLDATRLGHAIAELIDAADRFRTQPLGHAGIDYEERRGERPLLRSSLEGFTMNSMVAYGANCVWWDQKERVGTKPSGLPCCPRCGGVLFETETTAWYAAVLAFPGNARVQRGEYPTFVDWLRGRCYPTVIAALAAWRTAAAGETGTEGK